ncbi:zinc finger AN1 domain-containing stress-associated protein 12 [Euphorbia lathyris]|uniref:zinc finger AN1 domain-containing stress-associated protein 12 n=1 Tax=Euphorbia lathyris TaxID=212925 RepID=UPI0033144992
MGGGTEAFPDLGRHCQHSECNQLDFLPFKCIACQKVFCVDNRSYGSHNCPKSDKDSRKVMICEKCSVSMETTGCNEDEERLIMEKHVKSADCDPKRKKKAKCGVRRCKQILTFSNTSICKTCHIKVCLNHRFPADHACNKNKADNFLLAFAARTANDCSKIQSSSSSKSKPSNSVPVF